MAKKELQTPKAILGTVPKKTGMPKKMGGKKKK